MQVLVAGASGLIGTELVRRLGAEGHDRGVEPCADLARAADDQCLARRFEERLHPLAAFLPVLHQVGGELVDPLGRSVHRVHHGDGGLEPRSLGVIGGSEFTARPVLASYDPDLVRTATYAVTVEQQGGSPSGKPTSTPVYSGKLIETVPAPSL